MKEKTPLAGGKVEGKGKGEKSSIKEGIALL